MTNPENTADKKTSNRPFYLFAGGIGLILIVITIIIAVMNINKTPANPNDSEDPQNAVQIQEAPPTITGVEAILEEKTVSFNVQTSEYKTTEYKLEYELADQNRKVVESDIEAGSTFNIQTRNTGSAYYRIKVRLQDPETDQTSSWSDAYTIKLDEVQGVQKLEPAAAYYDTPWAKGTGGLDSLVEALQVAYTAQETTQAAGCIPLNTGTMTPTLLLPPNPSVMPKSAGLNFIINSWDAGKNEGNITYFWC